MTLFPILLSNTLQFPARLHQHYTKDVVPLRSVVPSHGLSEMFEDFKLITRGSRRGLRSSARRIPELADDFEKSEAV